MKVIQRKETMAKFGIQTDQYGEGWVTVRGECPWCAMTESHRHRIWVAVEAR